jgi:hypothetical protein
MEVIYFCKNSNKLNSIETKYFANIIYHFPINLFSMLFV